MAKRCGYSTETFGNDTTLAHLAAQKMLSDRSDLASDRLQWDEIEWQLEEHGIGHFFLQRLLT